MWQEECEEESRGIFSHIRDKSRLQFARLDVRTSVVVQWRDIGDDSAARGHYSITRWPPLKTANRDGDIKCQVASETFRDCFSRRISPRTLAPARDLPSSSLNEKVLCTKASPTESQELSEQRGVFSSRFQYCSCAPLGTASPASTFHVDVVVERLDTPECKGRTQHPQQQRLIQEQESLRRL